MSEWFVDGVRSDHLPIDDRAVQYGDGLFETIAIRRGAPRLLSLHLARLQDGCERLGIPVPDCDNLQRVLQAAILSSGLDTDFCAAKIIVSTGTGRRGYRRSAAAKSSIMIGLHPSQPLLKRSYIDGVRVVICATRVAVQPQLAGIKSLNRLEQVLARAEWTDAEVFDGLMCDADERLICGTMSNVFIVSDNTIATPDLAHCGVAGVMRRHILSVLAKRGVTVEVRDIALREAQSADEMFLSNSQIGAVPVQNLGSEKLGPAPESRSVLSLLAENGVSECKP